MSEQRHDQILVLMPVFNDWAAAALLLPRLDAVLAAHGIRARVLLVDDGSHAGPDDAMRQLRLRAIDSVQALRLRRNLGHQRAIAIGLSWVERNLAVGTVVVMDADGEDAPGDVPRLLEASAATGDPALVFAARHKRSEGLTFRIFYALYRTLHRLVTGLPVKVGNFSAVPSSALRRLVVVSELWNHYAAAVVRARIPFRTVATERAPRLTGDSSMNFVALVGHGLSALAVHGELVGVRLLIATLIPLVLVVGLVAVVVGVRLLTTLAIPGWATTAGGIGLVLLTQLLVLAGLFTMFTLNSRAAANFIPARDYQYYVDGEPTLLNEIQQNQPEAFSR